MLGFVPQPNLRGDAIALGEVVSTQVVLQGFSVTVDELLGWYAIAYFLARPEGGIDKLERFEGIGGKVDETGVLLAGGVVADLPHKVSKFTIWPFAVCI